MTSVPGVPSRQESVAPSDAARRVDIPPPTTGDRAGTHNPVEGMPPPRRPLWERPVVRAGVYAWALVGLVVIGLAGVQLISLLRVLVVPLVLALFPAAILAPVAARLRRVMPAGPAALLTLLGFVGLIAGIVALLAPSVADEIGGDAGIVQQARLGAQQAEQWLADGPFGFRPISVDQLLAQAQERLGSADGIAGSLFGAATALVEGFAELLFGLFALFFFLKDGDKIAEWLRDLFPVRVRPDAEAIGVQAWQTIGGYIRGQLTVALVDAVLIGIGIVVLGVPLALPLTLLVFLGGLFPIVGAVVAGLLAVLVALGTEGVGTALILLAVIIAVQQLEGHVLAPVVLGRATALHPMAAIAALTGGAVLLGVLGAFLSIPLTASATRAVGYLRERIAE